MLPDAMKERATAMENGDSAQALDMRIEAIPAYNTTPERMQYHPEGRDNGYVLTIGGSRFYITFICGHWGPSKVTCGEVQGPRTR